jgi:hypothetical protein
MNKTWLLFSSIAALVLIAIASPSFADDKAKGKEVTITGEAKCAKCALKEADACQTVIQAEGKDGKKVNYYLADNKLAKEFHKNVCSGTKEVTAIGTVKEVKGKQELTLTKIEMK